MGYYTSLTSFKCMECITSSFLLAAQQIDAMSSLSCSCFLAALIQRMIPIIIITSLTAYMGMMIVVAFIMILGSNDALWQLEDALGVAQHHNAMMGTAKQHVDDDYSLQLKCGLEKVALHIGQLLKMKLSTALGQN